VKPPRILNIGIIMMAYTYMLKLEPIDFDNCHPWLPSLSQPI
jgi:hypothetical protein